MVMRAAPPSALPPPDNTNPRGSQPHLKSPLCLRTTNGSAYGRGDLGVRWLEPAEHRQRVNFHVAVHVAESDLAQPRALILDRRDNIAVILPQPRDDFLMGHSAALFFLDLVQ